MQVNAPSIPGAEQAQLPEHGLGDGLASAAGAFGGDEDLDTAAAAAASGARLAAQPDLVDRPRTAPNRAHDFALADSHALAEHPVHARTA